MRSASLIGLLYTLTLLSPTGVAAGVDGAFPIKIFTNKYRTLDSAQKISVAETVRRELNLSPDGPYYKANVKILYNNYLEPDYLIVYLLSKEHYSVRRVRIDLLDFDLASAVSMDYTPYREDYSQNPFAKATCPDDTIQMLFSTAVTENPTAVAAIERAGELATQANYRHRLLFGDEENIAAIKSWLSCPNLIAWGRVGHGAPETIILADGELDYTYFENLSAIDLNNKVIYLNSCETFNQPLERAIFHAGTQNYIGGITFLDVGPSEEVFKCFWEDALEYRPLISSLRQCEIEYYPNDKIGDHGINTRHIDVNHPVEDYVDEIPILLVDDDDGKDYEFYFEEALDDLNRRFSTYRVPSGQDGPTAGMMKDHKIVIWLTGDDWTNTLTSNDQAQLADFLDSGGRLFITGQDIGYDLRTDSFYSDYLHAQYVVDDTNTYNLAGQDFLSDVNINISGGGGADNQKYPSEIALADSEAIGLFDYSGAYTWGGLFWADEHTGSRLVYFSFGFEAINSANDRALVLNYVLDRLLCPLPVTGTALVDGVVRDAHTFDWIPNARVSLVTRHCSGAVHDNVLYTDEFGSFYADVPSSGIEDGTITVTAAGYLPATKRYWADHNYTNVISDIFMTPQGVTAVFNDDFESDKGWQSNPYGSDTATTGRWERANPRQTSSSGRIYQLGEPPSGSYDLVTGASAGSSVGSNDIDNGVTSIRSPQIALPNASEITLMFVAYFAHVSNATSADYLKLQIVGSATQTVYERRGSSEYMEGMWQGVAVDLSHFAGQNIRILIKAADASSGSLIEAGVDDIYIEAR